MQQVSRERAAEILNENFYKSGEIPQLSASNLQYWAWPQAFGSTAGPFGGVGGQMISTFTIEAWTFSEQWAVLFCESKVLKVTNRFLPMMHV